MAINGKTWAFIAEAGVAVLAGMLFREIRKQYEAECKLIDAEVELATKDFLIDVKDFQIKLLTDELAKVKSESENKEQAQK